MGLVDLFRKKEPDGTYRRDRSGESREEFYDAGAEYTYGTFRMTVEDVFSITGRGTVVTGQVESGSVTVGDTVTLRRANGNISQVTVTGVEMFRKLMDTAKQGDNVGLLLRGVDKNAVDRGDVLEK